MIIAVALAGCTVDDAPLIDVDGRAMMEMTFGPVLQEPLTSEQATYRWDLVRAPEESEAEAPAGAGLATFVPDLRGIYVVERWLSYGLADRLTHRFVLHVEGAPPSAIVQGPTQVAVGGTVAVDASASASLEGRALTYRWRLAERPRDSTASLATPQEATTTFSADLAGVYAIELATFDGELWSERAQLAVEAR